MTPEAARIVMGTNVIAATPAVVWLTYALLGRKWGAPAGHFTSLVAGALFLGIMWVLTWSVGNSWNWRHWARTGWALLLVAFASFLGGSTVMGTGAHPLMGMYACFITGGLAWLVATTVLWSRPVSPDIRTVARRVAPDDIPPEYFAAGSPHVERPGI